MTGGTIGGIIVADLITGKPNPWADVYTPARVLPTIKDWSTLASEAAATAKGFAERLLPRSLKDLRGIVDAKGVERSVAPGEGMVVEEGLRKVALYRDGQGVVHRRSAICTHMGCLVEWNPLVRLEGKREDRMTVVKHMNSDALHVVAVMMMIPSVACCAVGDHEQVEASLLGLPLCLGRTKTSWLLT